jgi:hypothetical protein
MLNRNGTTGKTGQAPGVLMKGDFFHNMPCLRFSAVTVACGACPLFHQASSLNGKPKATTWRSSLRLPTISASRLHFIRLLRASLVFPPSPDRPRSEAVKKLGQAPSRPLIFHRFRRFRSEPVPFFHCLDPSITPFGNMKNRRASCRGSKNCPQLGRRLTTRCAVRGPNNNGCRIGNRLCQKHSIPIIVGWGFRPRSNRPITIVCWGLRRSNRIAR